jgi:Tetratricopeptide repeat/Fibronectin type III domain
MAGMSAKTAGQPPVSGEADPGAGPPSPTSEAVPAASGPDQALAAAHAEARQRAEGGDLTGARTLLEDALAIGEVRLGHDHPRLAPLMVDLATVARGLGNLTEALTQLRRAYAIVAATGGPDHPTALSIEGRLAAVMYRLGEATEAYDWHLADVGTRVLGAEHPAVKGAQQRLAAAEQAQAVAATWTPEPEPLLPSAIPNQSWDPDEPGLAPTYAPAAPGVYQRVYQPAAPQSSAAEVWQDRPAGIPRRRGHRGGAALVGGLGAAILVAAVVMAVQLFGSGFGTHDSAAPPTAPNTAAAAASPVPPSPTVPALPPPADVRLTDNGESVTLTWSDPSNGRVPFIVAGGRDDAGSSPFTTVDPGRTTATIYGLRTDTNYCFTVAAVWSADTIMTSPRTCTQRLSTTRTP